MMSSGARAPRYDQPCLRTSCGLAQAVIQLWPDSWQMNSRRRSARGRATRMLSSKTKTQYSFRIAAMHDKGAALSARRRSRRQQISPQGRRVHGSLH